MAVIAEVLGGLASVEEREASMGDAAFINFVSRQRHGLAYVAITVENVAYANSTIELTTQPLPALAMVRMCEIKKLVARTASPKAMIIADTCQKSHLEVVNEKCIP